MTGIQKLVENNSKMTVDMSMYIDIQMKSLRTDMLHMQKFLLNMDRYLCKELRDIKESILAINVNGLENQQLLTAVGRVLYGDDEDSRESFEAAVAPYLSSDPHQRAFSSGSMMDMVNRSRNGVGALSDDEILDIITTRLDHFRLPPVPEVSQEDEEELDPQEDHNDGFATQIQLMKSTRVREPFPKTLREKFNNLEAIKDARMETPFSPIPILGLEDDPVWANAISNTGKAKNKSNLKGTRHDPEPLVRDIFKAEEKKQEEDERNRKKIARQQAQALLQKKAEREPNGPIPEATLIRDDGDDRSDAQRKADLEMLKKAREIKKRLKAQAEQSKERKRKASNEDTAPLTKKQRVAPNSVAAKMRDDPKLRSQPSVQLQDVVANPPSVESNDSVELLAIKRKPKPRPLSVASVSTSTLNISGHQEDDQDDLSADSDDELIPKREVNVFMQKAKTATKKAKTAEEVAAKAQEENAKLRGQIRQQWDANKAERDHLQSSNEQLQARIRELEETNKVLIFNEAKDAKVANVATDNEIPFALPPADGPFQWPMPARTPGDQIKRLAYLDQHGYAEEDEYDNAEAEDAVEATSDDDEGVEEAEAEELGEAEAEEEEEAEAEAEEDDDEGIEDVVDSSDESHDKQNSSGSDGKLMIDEVAPKRKRSSDDNQDDEPSAKKGKATDN